MQELTSRRAKWARINALQSKLAETDYKALKAFEGEPSSDWEIVRANRSKWRKEIDTLQDQVDTIDRSGDTHSFNHTIE